MTSSVEPSAMAPSIQQQPRDRRQRKQRHDGGLYVAVNLRRRGSTEPDQHQEDDI